MAETTSDNFTTSTARSGRPAKRAKAATAIEKHGDEIEALFANPDRALEKAAGPKPKVLAAPPEIVTNVQGSSAGAGSGEFHVYKASRRREYERLRAMDEVVEREKADQEWEQKREEARSKEDAKLNKNRARREKQKARQAKTKSDGTTGSETAVADGLQREKKKFAPAKSVITDTATENGAEVAPHTVEAAGLTILEDD